MLNETIKKCQEEAREEMLNSALACSDRDAMPDQENINLFYKDLDTLISQTAHSVLEEVRRVAEGMKKIPTRHDRCTLDDIWCYNHREIMEEKDYPNGAYDYNSSLTDLLTAITPDVSKDVTK